MRNERVLVKGVALHFFDAGLGQKGSDKFYRALMYQMPTNLHWMVLVCWGRDGTDGQFKWQRFDTEREAWKLVDKKVGEKVRHGYEVLGRGDTVMAVTNRDERLIGQELADAVSAREPDKTRMTGGIIIHEEPDLMDLLG